MAASLNSQVRWHEQQVTTQMRSDLMQQKGACIWFTGLSGSGKSTQANALDYEFHRAGKRTLLLDGDNLRHGLCRDLGMSEPDRAENIRRAGEVARLMVDAGLIVICAFISPFERDRSLVRQLFPQNQFTEIFVATDLSTCEKRDPKGLYQKARRGLIKNFTGIDSIYEAPLAADLKIDTSLESIEDSLAKLLLFLRDRGLFETHAHGASG